MALNLARNRRFAVFPVGEDKQPTLKGWPERASTEPDAIAAMWRERPGPLIGIATGKPSGVSVLDVDQKHHEAWEWWQAHHAQLLPCRAFQTRSGGLHLYMLDPDGAVPTTTRRICLGVDTRGRRGYIVFWFAAGFACHDHEPPQPWPAWLLEALRPPAPSRASFARPPDMTHVVAGIVRHVASAAEGERNALTFWASCKLRDHGMQQGDIEGLLLPVASAIGLSDIEARRTISSAMGRAAA